MFLCVSDKIKRLFKKPALKLFHFSAIPSNRGHAFTELI